MCPAERVHRTLSGALLLKRILARPDSYLGRLAARFACDIGDSSELFPSLPHRVSEAPLQISHENLDIT